MTDQAPPEWGQAPDPAPPRRKPKWYASPLFWTVTLVGLIGLLVAVVVIAAPSQRATTSAPQATAAPAPEPTPTTGETFPDEGVSEPTKPEVVHNRVGETATLIETDTGREVAKVQVVKVRFSAGDEFNRPERGNFLGVYVKTKALADDQTSLWGDFYVTMNGHHYDGDAYAEGFEPSLDYIDLNAGETAEGWLVFDVPARHGEVVLAQSDGSGKIGTWKF